MEEGNWRVDPNDQRYLRYFDGTNWTRRRVLRSDVEIKANPKVDPRLADIRSASDATIINTSSEHGL